MRRLVVTIGVAATGLAIMIAPGHASPGYHHTGAYTTQQFYGADATIEITNPTLTGNPCQTSNDFFVSRIMAVQGSWMEVGWGEVGWLTPGQCIHGKSIYVYDTTHNVWEFFTQYPLTIPGTIRVRVFSESTCDGNAPCQWRTRLLWNGTWVTLHAAMLNLNANAYIEEMAEVYTPSGHHFAIASCCDGSGGDVDWWETMLLKSDRTWASWGTSAPTVTGNNIPYYTNWLTYHSRFKSYKGIDE